MDVAVSWKNFEDCGQSESIQDLQARVKELEDASTKQKRALVESEKHRLRLHKLSELNQSTL